ncbi:MAG: hypothetical protein QM234_08305 [Acidobacteriota bacterium]|nr:hypothetical protein [Acidobacteriota bacterium]
MNKKTPSFQFYPGDWLKDPALMTCSYTERGIWMSILCLMFLSPTKYSLTKCVSHKRVGLKISEVAKALRVQKKSLLALVEKGVMRQSRRSGIFFSARLLRDERARRRWARNKRLSRETRQRQKRNVSRLSRRSSSSDITSVGASAVSNKTHAPQAPFDTPAFREAWADWEQSRREARKPLKPTTIRLQFRKLQEMGHDRAVAALRYSAANGYTGIFEEASRERPSKTGGLPQRGERITPKILVGHGAVSPVSPGLPPAGRDETLPGLRGDHSPF